MKTIEQVEMEYVQCFGLVQQAERIGERAHERRLMAQGARMALRWVMLKGGRRPSTDIRRRT